MTGQCIGPHKKFPRNLDNFQVKVSQVKELSGLASVQFLGLMEVCQVLVVSEYLYQEGRTVKVVLP